MHTNRNYKIKYNFRPSFPISQVHSFAQCMRTAVSVPRTAMTNSHKPGGQRNTNLLSQFQRPEAEGEGVTRPVLQSWRRTLPCLVQLWQPQRLSFQQHSSHLCLPKELPPPPSQGHMASPVCTSFLPLCLLQAHCIQGHSNFRMTS